MKKLCTFAWLAMTAAASVEETAVGLEHSSEGFPDNSELIQISAHSGSEVHEPVDSSNSEVSDLSTHSEVSGDLSAQAVKSDELSSLLSQLYGDSIDAFASDANKDRGTLMVDCTSTSEDSDFKINIVTTLCPFLRKDGPCGQLRHPSYVAENEKLFCSQECLPHIDALVKALPHRSSLTRTHESSIFRGVSDSILSQYCVDCREGCFLPT